MTKVITVLGCAMVGVPLISINPVWGLWTSFIALTGDGLALHPVFMVLDVINGISLTVWSIYTAHTYCHWTSWFVSIPAFMSWSVGVYAIRKGKPEDAEIAHNIWHLLAFTSFSIIAYSI